MAREVDRREEPKVDLDTSLLPSRVAPHHQNVDPQQKLMEHHVANVHHKYGQVLNNFKSTDEYFRVHWLHKDNREVDNTREQPEEDADNDCCFTLTSRRLAVLGTARDHFVVVVAVADEDCDHDEEDGNVEVKENLAGQLGA